MIHKTANPEIDERHVITAKSNGIQFCFGQEDRKELWPLWVKMHPNGVLAILARHYGVCKYNNKVVYDFRKETLENLPDKWFDITPNNPFYSEIRKVYEINQQRKLKHKQKSEEIEFKHALKAIDNDFTKKEFLTILLEKFNIMLFFYEDQEVAKVYNARQDLGYCVKVNSNGEPYYGKKYGQDTHSIRVSFFFGKKKIAGVYTWETMCDIVNMKRMKDITVDELKEIIGTKQVKEVV